MNPLLGLVPHYDPNNEKYPVDTYIAKARSVAAIGIKPKTAVLEPAGPEQEPRAQAIQAAGDTAPPLPLKSKKHRAWWWGDQGQTPRCTSFGTLHLMADAPVTHPKQNPLKDPQAFYEQIQARDRQAGRYYAEGATTVAAMLSARDNGWISEFRWGWLISQAQEAVQIAPLIFGTNWYSSMFQRDAEGIIRISPAARIEGGHLYCVNAWDKKRDLYRIHQTWGDGYYFIPGSDLERLINEDGDFAMVSENRT